MSETIESEVPEVKDIQLDELVKVYLTIRNQKDKLYNEYKLKEAELKNELVQIEQVLLSKCNEMNADSVRTSAGTIVKTLKEEFVCSDWGSFTEYLKEHNAIELLWMRLHQSNFKEHMITHANEGLPPGISTMREFNIVVKKPTVRS
jgi:hypothetical protein